MKTHIYADNAATTQIDKSALEEMQKWLYEEYGNASQPYGFSQGPKKAVENARKTIAECIGADPEEIFFTSGGTESDNWVIKSSALYDKEKKETITSAIEHHAVLNACKTVERLGYPVSYLHPTKEGIITKECLKNCLNSKTRLVSIMFANNEIGSIQPIRELCYLAHEHGALFHTDAVQAVGHVGINVHELCVDYLSASAHKFNGPKGIGFLYMRKGVELHPFIDGGKQEYGRRAGTENVAAIVGMSIALKKNCAELEKNQRYIRSLENSLISKLDQANVCYLRNGSQEKLPGLLSLSFPGKEGESILHRMDLMGICISTGSACNSENTEISHVLRAVGISEEYAKGTIRISFGKNNTEDEVEKTASALIKIVH